MSKKTTSGGTRKSGKNATITSNKKSTNKSTGKRSYHPTPPKPKPGGGDKK